MSVSNYVCRERDPVEYIQCWVPVQHVDASKGIIPMFKGLVNKGRAVVYGGDAKQYEAYDHMWASLQDIYKNTNTYKKTGVLTERMKELIAWAEVWENRYAVAHGQPEVYPGVLPPGQNPPAYAPAPAPSAPSFPKGVQVCWVPRQPISLAEYSAPHWWVSLPSRQI